MDDESAVGVVAVALDRVLQDLLTYEDMSCIGSLSDCPPVRSESPDGDRGCVLVVFQIGEAVSVEIEVYADTQSEFLVYQIANRVQEALIEQRIEWPPCPLHAHPLWARFFGSSAMWQCSAEAGPIVAIGSLE